MPNERKEELKDGRLLSYNDMEIEYKEDSIETINPNNLNQKENSILDSDLMNQIVNEQSLESQLVKDVDNLFKTNKSKKIENRDIKEMEKFHNDIEQQWKELDGNN